MHWHALAKRLARTGGLACMIAGGLLTGVGIVEAIEICPGVECDDAKFDAATYAATFFFGGMVFFWGKKVG